MTGNTCCQSKTDTINSRTSQGVGRPRLTPFFRPLLSHRLDPRYRLEQHLRTMIDTSVLEDEVPDLANPFGSITEADKVTYAGRTIAVCRKTGRILADGSSRPDLASIMSVQFPNTKYNVITLPPLAEGSDSAVTDVTEESTAAFLAILDE